MNKSLFGAIGALAAAIVVGSCKEDPTASSAGGARTLIANPNPVVVSAGANGSFVAAAYDALLNPLPATFTAISSDPTVATVALDPVNPDPNGTRQRFTVTGLKPGRSLIQVAQASGGNLSVTDTANVAPIVFDGAISNLSPAGGSSITISSTSLLKFSSSPAVTFGGGIGGAVAAHTSDLVTVITPFSDPGKLKIDSVAPTYIATNEYSLNTVGSVTQTGDFWVGDSSATTAPTISLPAGQQCRLPRRCRVRIPRPVHVLPVQSGRHHDNKVPGGLGRDARRSDRPRRLRLHGCYRAIALLRHQSGVRDCRKAKEHHHSGEAAGVVLFHVPRGYALSCDRTPDYVQSHWHHATEERPGDDHKATVAAVSVVRP